MYQKNELGLKFRQAAASGNLNACQNLRSQVKINDAGADSGKTALHWASQNGHARVVSFLIDNGAKITLDKDDRTPFALAQRAGRKHICRILMYHFPEFREVNGDIPMEDAIAYGFTISEEIQQNISNGIQRVCKSIKNMPLIEQVLTDNGLSVNSYLNGLPLLSLVLISNNPNRYKPYIDFFIERRVNLNLQAHPMQYDYYHGTIFHSLLAYERMGAAIYLLTKAQENNISIDFSICDEENKTILLMGVLLRNVEFVSQCLSMLTNNDVINIADEDGRTPLHYAYLLGHREMIELLINHGADTQLMDKKGKRADEMLISHEDVIIDALYKFHISAHRNAGGGKTLLQICLKGREDLLDETVSNLTLPSSLS